MYEKYAIDRPIDMKLNVRPVYNALIHQVAFEGPCRFGDKDELTKEFDELSAKEGFKRFSARIASIGEGNPDINMLEPVLTTGTDEFVYQEDVFEKLAENVGDVDVFFIQAVSPSTTSSYSGNDRAFWQAHHFVQFFGYYYRGQYLFVPLARGQGNLRRYRLESGRAFHARHEGQESACSHACS